MKGHSILLLMFVLFNSYFCRPEDPEYKLCELKAHPVFGKKEKVHILRGYGGICKGCDLLKNCTTFDGSIQIQGFHQVLNGDLKKELHFPKLTEITGHLLISLLYKVKDLESIFPNLAVIRGNHLFLDYALVIYQNDGLNQINLPSLTTILSGGIRIEKNINLCYVKTIRWKSIMKMNSEDPYSLVTTSNNNDCYDLCYKGKCFPPAGHGDSGNQYCWGSGTVHDYSCQRLCDMKCGDAGCVKGQNNLCCHPQCLGGCSKINSPFHCYACKNLRLNTGKCVSKCPPELLEVDNFRCIPPPCPKLYNKLDGSCVKECPAGYAKEGNVCEKCLEQRCPRVCSVKQSAINSDEGKPIIDSLNSLREYKGCTEIDGTLEIRIRGGGATIYRDLEENLGMIEKVKGYVLIRQSLSLVSLKFLKNLKIIEPRKTFSITEKKMVPFLYNNRYALTIMENPKLEAMWDYFPNFTIKHGGLLVRMNPRLCTNKIEPLIDVLKWNNSSNGQNIDVSQTTNGNDVACEVETINMTVREIIKPSFMQRCSHICIEVKWNEVRIDEDYRNVLFYTISYREAPNTEITQFDDVGACSNQDVWKRVDVSVRAQEMINASGNSYGSFRDHSRVISTLKPYTLYAFYVEVVTLNKKGARSSLKFLKTREMVPSAVVGLEVSYLDPHSLLVKWQPPLFPNGNITKYVIKYQESQYSVWEQGNIDWCIRQALPSRRVRVEDNKKDENNEGKCNITCDCNKEKEVVRPEKQAAIFAKEFQDALFRTIFTKDKDDNPSPTTNRTTIIPTTEMLLLNRTNCSREQQESGLCGTSTSPTSSANTASGVSTSSLVSPTGNLTTTDAGGSGEVTPTFVTPTTAIPILTEVVDGSKAELRLTGLRHFTDYTIMVCACTKVRCAQDTACSSTKGRTGRKAFADNLGGPATVIVQNNTKRYNISWIAPKDPNSVVLKYDIEIFQPSREKPEVACQLAKQPTWIERVGIVGNYSARIRAITPAGNGSWSNTVYFAISEETKEINKNALVEKGTNVGVIIGASLAACSFIILACGVVIWYITRKRYKAKQTHTVLYASVNPEYLNSTDVYIADEWEVPRDKIKLIRELGQGSFGMVFEGEALDIVKDKPKCRVAVKTVSENASVRDRIEFLQEASIMKAFHCHHVVELLGVVSDGQPTLVIMELMHNGDLKNHLRSRRPEEGGELPPPTLPEMLQMAGEIADGMAYLASRKFVHRDLAARNCMVNENLTVKIGDFGMTRDIYETDYYRKGGKGLLPVRWMAPESLKDGIFSSPSDVWSYGVVLWEMATLASQPYPGKSNEEVLKFVVDGGVMDKPMDAPNELYDLMTLCWQHSPKARPTFLTIIHMIEDSLSNEFKTKSFYSNLSRDHLQEMLKFRSFHIPRQRAETIQTEAESSA
ncbi:putative insulin-like peptide receptor [Actinia tenebrosa]|uniref:Tyrosine-protein kinase receptor n=1 Tax=Actinia tenebrosa TaxID=6105 RepID=A0A6P8HZT2_ACTTE|nr:putative insulin-like peptide receptor [Actinia tenebrosa]